MKAYEKYQKTNIEWFSEIPDNWKVLRLKRLINPYKYYQIGDGDHGSIKPEMYQESGIPYFRVQNLSWDGKLDLDGIAFISHKVHNENLKSRLLPGDILIAKTGATIGKLAYLDDSIEEGNTTSSVAKITIDKRSFEPKFFLYYFQLPEFKDQIWIDASQKSAQPGFNVDDLVDYSAPIPPLPEQRQIAAYLDYKTNQIDRFIANRKKQIELLEEQVASHINRLMSEGIKRNPTKQPTGIPYLPEIPTHWDLRKFVGLTKILTCGLASTPDYVSEEEGVPFFSAQNCRPFRMDLSNYNYIKPELHKQLTKYKKPEKGDVLVTRVGAGIGQACVIDTDLEFSVYVSLTHIRPTKEILSEYIVYFFNTEYSRQLNFEGTVVGGGQGNLNVNNVAKYKMPLPPIDEQREIVLYLDEKRQEIGELISKYQKQIDLMQEYKTALISKAVTGKIDVREWQPKQTIKETV